MAMLVISPEETKKLQQVGLRMLLFFDRFCTENGLTWYFCGGCCIGTVRGGGFIPWDDDVDVFMPREDYEKLKLLWRDTEKYAIQYPTEEVCTANQFVTICDNDTTFIKTYQKELDIRHGVMMDVLPLDGCPSGIHRKAQKLWALLYSLFVVGKAPENHGRFVEALGKTALALVPSWKGRCRIWKRAEKKMSRWPIASCEKITELCSGPHYMQNEYPKSCFERPLRMEFEGHLLAMPSDWETYLTMAFGDFRTLPPEEKRICHHEYEVIDPEHGYETYRGKAYYIRNGKAP